MGSEVGLFKVIERIGEINNKFSFPKTSGTNVSENNSFNSVLKGEIEKGGNSKEKTEKNDLQNKFSEGNEETIKLIGEISKKYNIPSQLVDSIIKAESNYNPNALSPKGAMGIMQLMPSTATQLGVKNPWDIKENLEGGIKYLTSLLTKYNGDLKLALAAYNAGPSAVDSYSGIPPYQETRDYINKVLKNLNGE